MGIKSLAVKPNTQMDSEIPKLLLYLQKLEYYELIKCGSIKCRLKCKLKKLPIRIFVLKQKSKNCVACLSSGENLKYQLQEMNFEKLTEITESQP